MPVYENERGTYIFNSKDLCMIEHIPELIDAGIDSFKIEGRMKTALYVATVARTYRKAIDDYLDRSGTLQERICRGIWIRYQIVRTASSRQVFILESPDEETQIYDSNTYVKEYTYLGIIGREKRRVCTGSNSAINFLWVRQIEIMKPDGRNVEVTVRKNHRWRWQGTDECAAPQAGSFR